MSMERIDLDNGGNSTNAASGRSGPNLRLILAGIVLAIIVVFTLRNGDVTELDFMFFNWETTVRWSIFVAVLLGILLDRLVLSWWRRRGRRADKN